MSAVSLQSESDFCKKKEKVLNGDQFKSAKLESRPIAPVIREFICEAEEVWSKNGGAEVAKEEAT